MRQLLVDNLNLFPLARREILLEEAQRNFEKAQAQEEEYLRQERAKEMKPKIKNMEKLLAQNGLI